MALQVIPADNTIFVDATPSPLDRVLRIGPQSQLGYGLTRPFRRAANDFVTAEGEALIRACVGQVLGTLGTSPKTQGELRWNPAFGSWLALIRHRNNDVVLQQLGRVYVLDALRAWEPRIRPKTVTITRGTHPVTGLAEVLIIRIVYDVVAVNTTANNVLFSDIDQTVILPQAA